MRAYPIEITLQLVQEVSLQKEDRPSTPKVANTATRKQELVRFDTLTKDKEEKKSDRDSSATRQGSIQKRRSYRQIFAKDEELYLSENQATPVRQIETPYLRDTD